MTHQTDSNIGCCVILRDATGKVLFAKRKNAYKAGYFGLPGGRVEGDERLTDCAARELFEETNLRAAHLDFLGVVREWQPDYPTGTPNSFVHFIFLCTSWEGSPITKEPGKAEQWSWHDTSHLPHPVLPAHLAGIQLLGTHKTLEDIRTDMPSDSTAT